MRAWTGKRSVIVVGAGVIGTTTAIELRARGFAVQLLDRGRPPCADASSFDISKAVRTDYGNDAFYFDLALRSMRRWRQWNLDWGEQVYHEVGFLVLSRSPMSPGSFEGDGFAMLVERGRPVERIDAERLRSRFPAWSPSAYVDGYLNPRGGYASSDRVMRRLVQRAVESGVVLRAHAALAGLQFEGGRVVGVVTAAGETLRAESVVVAAGAWTPRLLPHLAERLVPVPQPVFLFKPADAAPFAAERFPVWAADIARTGWYGFPANADGLVKVGNHGPGLRGAPDETIVVGDELVASCRDFLRASLPALAEAFLAGSRVCFYCDTPDADFWIDRDPDHEGLVVAAGGSGHAFKFAPVMGEIVADIVEGRPNPDAPRFAWRESGRGWSEQARRR